MINFHRTMLLIISIFLCSQVYYKDIDKLFEQAKEEYENEKRNDSLFVRNMDILQLDKSKSNKIFSKKDVIEFLTKYDYRGIKLEMITNNNIIEPKGNLAIGIQNIVDFKKDGYDNIKEKIPVSIVIFAYDDFDQAKKAILFTFTQISSTQFIKRKDFKEEIIGDYCWHSKGLTGEGGSLKILFANLNISITVFCDTNKYWLNKSQTVKNDLLAQNIAEDIVFKLEQWPSESDNFIYRYYNKAKEIIKK